MDRSRSSGNQVVTSTVTEVSFGFQGGSGSQAVHAWEAPSVHLDLAGAETGVDYPEKAVVTVSAVMIEEKYERYHNTTELVRIFSTTLDATRREGLFAACM